MDISSNNLHGSIIQHGAHDHSDRIIDHAPQVTFAAGLVFSADDIHALPDPQGLALTA